MVTFQVGNQLYVKDGVLHSSFNDHQVIITDAINSLIFQIFFRKKSNYISLFFLAIFIEQ